MRKMKKVCAASSRRFKKEVKPMDKTSEAILALKPMRFHYNSDKSNTPQFGLIAEEVAQDCRAPAKANRNTYWGPRESERPA
jgi:hypothetical protein